MAFVDECCLCEEDVDSEKPYYEEEITKWKDGNGECITKYYHEICFMRSHR